MPSAGNVWWVLVTLVSTLLFLGYAKAGTSSDALQAAMQPPEEQPTDR